MKMGKMKSLALMPGRDSGNGTCNGCAWCADGRAYGWCKYEGEETEVMDDGNCMVDVARFFLDFTQRESCGKCTFCRVGSKRMLEVLTRITEGKGQDGDIELLEELAARVKNSSLCGLGQTAPNPVLTTLRYFADEYAAHVHDRTCPAGACTALL